MEEIASASVHLTSEINDRTRGSRDSGDMLDLPGTSLEGNCSSCSNSPGPHSPSASAPLTSAGAGRKKSACESGRGIRNSEDRRKSSGGGLSGTGGGGGGDEKHGLLHYAIPIMPLPLAALLCLLNIIAPGIGTFFASLSCFCCGRTRVGRPLKGFGLNLLAALLQMLTFFLIVGWIWSILWGMTFVQLALCSEKNRKMSMSYYVRRQSSVE